MTTRLSRFLLSAACVCCGLTLAVLVMERYVPAVVCGVRQAMSFDPDANRWQAIGTCGFYLAAFVLCATFSLGLWARAIRQSGRIPRTWRMLALLLAGAGGTWGALIATGIVASGQPAFSLLALLGAAPIVALVGILISRRVEVVLGWAMVLAGAVCLGVFLIAPQQIHMFWCDRHTVVRSLYVGAALGMIGAGLALCLVAGVSRRPRREPEPPVNS